MTKGSEKKTSFYGAAGWGAALLLALTGCGAAGETTVAAGRTVNAPASVEEILQEGMEAADEGAVQIGPVSTDGLGSGTELDAEEPERETETDSGAGDAVGSGQTDSSGTSEEPGESDEAGELEESGEPAWFDAPMERGDAELVDLTAMSSTMVYSEVYNMMALPEDYVGKTVRMAGTSVFFRDEETGKYYFSCLIQDAAACCAQGIEYVLEAGFASPEDYPEYGEDIQVIGVFDTYYEGPYQYCTLRDAVLE